MIVMKFGGTSVGTADAMRLVAKALVNNREKKIVVLSASAGITDKLINITNSLPENIVQANLIYNEIESQILNICHKLEFQEDSLKKVEEIVYKVKELIFGVELLDYLSDSIANRIVSYGEILSTTIFYEFIKSKVTCEFVDITNFLIYDSQSDDFELTNKEEINKIFESANTIITQGFICKNRDGKISNLGRGGSDYSASILASELGASELQIWTDVNGVMSADPRIVKNPLTKNKINISSLERMAFFGAKVIHPNTLKPTLKSNIPVRILNTFDTNNNGTLVTKDSENRIPTFTIKRKCNLYTFKTVTKKNLYYINKYITSLTVVRSLNLLSSIDMDNSIHYVFDQKIEKFMELEHSFTSKEIDLIYICELTNSKINAILTNLNILNLEQLEIDWANSSILLLANADNKTQDYDRFHDMLINIDN